MKKLLFDLLHAQPLDGVKFHGGGEYIKSVFQKLSQIEDAQYQLEVCLNQNEFIDDWIWTIINKKKIKTYQVSTAIDVVAVMDKMEDKQNLRFFTGMIYPYNQMNFPEGVKTFGVCHGLRGLEKQYDCEAIHYISNKADLKECIRNTLLKKRTRRNLYNYYFQLLEKFDVVITVSQHSAYSIKINFPEIAKKKNILVFYTPPKYTEIPAEKENTEPYIMMVSANRWLKNCYRGVMAIDHLYQKGFLTDVKTRIYGNLPIKIRKKLKYRDNFVFYDYVSSEELERAYQNCTVFFYPTLNEGFGLPPLEAMKYGRTCVISAICSLPEIYGDSVYYCNPYDLMEMENRLLHAVRSNIALDKVEKQVKIITKKQKDDLENLAEILLNS